MVVIGALCFRVLADANRARKKWEKDAGLSPRQFQGGVKQSDKSHSDVSTIADDGWPNGQRSDGAFFGTGSRHPS